MDNLDKKKIISVGVYANDTNRNTFGRTAVGEKNLNKTTRDSYRDQLERDERQRREAKEIEKQYSAVHPFELPNQSSALRDKHNSIAADEVYAGYAIGNQSDKSEVLALRKESQMKYLNQLEHDIALAAEIRIREEFSPEKKVIPRRPASPEVKGEFVIGAASTVDGARNKEAAKEFYKLNQEDIARREALKRQKSKDIDIDSRFSIGGGDERSRARKEEQKRAYVEALNKDIGDRSQTRKFNKDEEYINKTGWSGLNVGGVANGQTASVQQLNQKREKQEYYRRSLDEQLQSAADYKIRQRLEEEENARQRFNPPYLEERDQN